MAIKSNKNIRNRQTTIIFLYLFSPVEFTLSLSAKIVFTKSSISFSVLLCFSGTTCTTKPSFSNWLLSFPLGIFSTFEGRRKNLYMLLSQRVIHPSWFAFRVDDHKRVLGVHTAWQDYTAM